MEFVLNNITLSGITSGDANDITAYMQDKEISDATRIPFPYTLQHAQQWIEDNQVFELAHGFKHNYAIRNQAGKLLGCIGLHFNYGYNADKSEFGYWLGKPHRNQGIMTDAIRLLMVIAVQNHKLTSIEAKVYPFNIASQKVLVKTGFVINEQPGDDNDPGNQQKAPTIKYIKHL